MSEKINTSTMTLPETQGNYYWTLERRRQLMELPKAERQAILAEQAREAAKYYEDDPEIENIGGGEFLGNK
jgi:hypothetical protein